MTRTGWVPWLCSGLLAVAGCVVPITVGDVDDDAQGTGGGTMSSANEGTAETEGATSGMLPGDSTTLDDPGDGTINSGTVGDDDTGGDDTGEPVSICDPQPEDISGLFVLLQEGEKWLDPVFWQWDQQCEVVGIDIVELGRRIELDCEEVETPGPPTIELLMSEPRLDLPLELGQMVRYRGLYDVGIDTPSERYTAVSSLSGELLLGSWWSAKDTYADDAAELFAPLSFQLASDVCDPEPYETPINEGRPFIFDPCGEQIERHAIDVSVAEAAPERIFDHHRQTVGGYDVWVLQADTADPQERECSLQVLRTRTRMIMVAVP